MSIYVQLFSILLNKTIYCKHQQADDQVPPSELQHDSSSSQTVKQDETMMQSQNTSNEQQQQQDQGHGSSHQDSTEGRSGVSTISQSEKKDFNNKQVNLLVSIMQSVLNFL